MRAGILHDAGFLSDRSPSKIESEPPAAIDRDPVMVDARRCDSRKDSHQVWRFRLGRPPLHVSQVGSSFHAHLAVRPRLGGRPFDGVVAIVDIVSERLPTPFRLVPSAHILEDIRIPSPGKVDCRRVGGGSPLGRIGSARHDDGVLAIANWSVQVGIENDSVAHGYRDAVLDLDVIAGRGRLREFVPGGQSADPQHKGNG